MEMRPLARWLPSPTPLRHQYIVRRALCDVGICEMPPGSNRSATIDEYATAVGSPLGSYWCAAALAAWWREAGTETPPSGAGSCEAWHQWAKATQRWTTSHPREGDAVLFSFAGDGRADHCGVIIRCAPLILTVEGNTTLAGYSRNGVAVAVKCLNADHVLGYVSPVPFTSAGDSPQ